MSQDTAMACSIRAGQTAAEAHGQQSSPLQHKALAAESLSTALQQEWSQIKDVISSEFQSEL